MQNVLGMCLSYEEQFYDWNIINMPEARYELFKSAVPHTILLAALMVAYYWKYDYQPSGFAALSSEEDLPL